VRIDYKGGAYYLSAREPFATFAALVAHYRSHPIDEARIPISLGEAVHANVHARLEDTEDGYMHSTLSVADRL
jgi:hypothetical protein